MADEKAWNFLGFEIKRNKSKDNTNNSVAIVPPNDDDGAGYVTSVGGGHYGQYVDIDGDKAKDNYHLIMKYRGASMYPEVDLAIGEIVNEAIVPNDEGASVELRLDNIETTDKIKDTIREEFDRILSLLDFNDNGSDMFKRWYVDGRLVHQIIIDEKNPKHGLQELRFMDGAKVRKIRDIKYKKDPLTGVKTVDKVEEYFIYQEGPGNPSTTVKLSLDSISYVTSGLLDETRKKVVSHLHKSLKAINQLKMMEDSLVIYRLARAPERRIFYIDVGNLPKGKAEEYMKGIMAKYRNKLVYDQATGEIKDDRKHMSMLEDFWLPRREGGRGTEISSLPGGQNLGQIDDVLYFQKRLYKSLNVPAGRMDDEASPFSIGRSTEISRQEIKFQRFIDQLRRKFSKLFLELLRKQLLLKGVITQEDWDKWKSNIVVDFLKDNHFDELKESEIIRERISTLDTMSQYVGEYYTRNFVMRKVLRLTDEEISDLEKEKKKAEKEEGDTPPTEEEAPQAPQNSHYELKPVEPSQPKEPKPTAKND